MQHIAINTKRFTKCFSVEYDFNVTWRVLKVEQEIHTLPVFRRVLPYIVVWVVICSLLFFFVSLLCIVILLSVLRFADSDYQFGVFNKHFWDKSLFVLPSCFSRLCASYHNRFILWSKGWLSCRPYCCWFHLYICNQYLSSLHLWVRFRSWKGVLDNTFCDNKSLEIPRG